MLSYYGIEGVQVHRGGSDQNFFNPKDNSVRSLTMFLTALLSPLLLRRATRWVTAGQYAMGYAAHEGTRRSCSCG